MKSVFCVGSCVLAVLCGCGVALRTPLTAQGFREHMESAGFEVGDATEQFATEGALTVYVAMNDLYQVEFYEFDDEFLCEASFLATKTNMEDIRGAGSSHTSLEYANYNSYFLTTKDGYYVASRTDATLLYAAVPLDQKEELRKLVAELGY